MDSKRPPLPDHLPLPPPTPKSNAVRSKVGQEGTEEAWRLARGCVFMVDGEDGEGGAGSEDRGHGRFRWANGRPLNTGRHEGASPRVWEAVLPCSLVPG